MANSLKLPVGIENFEEIRKFGFYYMDKTKLIEQLVETRRQPNSFYPSPPLWKNIKYEYAAGFF